MKSWNNKTVVGIVWLFAEVDASQSDPKIRKMIDWFKNRGLPTIKRPENMEVGFEITVKDIFDFNMKFFNPSLVGIFRPTSPGMKNAAGYGSWISFETLPEPVLEQTLKD